MHTRSYGLILGSIAYFTLLSVKVEAGPVSRKLKREVYPEIESDSDVNQSQVCIVGDLVYGINEAVPSEQPCLRCKCQPPGVQCEALRCANKKPGCKMVHRPNECCPDYQCECEYKGKIYSNGERLETSPADECKVCYCRGGEIKCADVSCYVRNDCEGKQVPGQCCPKYDHCPTRDSLDKLPLNISFSLSAIPDSSTVEENSFTSPFTNTPTAKDEDSDNRIQPDGGDSINSLQNSKITIQEIIPEILEIPITSNPKEEFKQETQGKLIIEETKATEEIGKENDLFVTDSEGESSEITEVIQSPPPVIRIGDNLLFLKKNELINEKDASSTPSSIITLIGAEGLQRGGVEEAENITSLDHLTSSSQDFPSTEDKTNDLVSASSTHILSLVKKKKKPPTQTTTVSLPPTVSEEIITTPTALSDLPPSESSEHQKISSTEESSTQNSPSSQDASQTPETITVIETSAPDSNITEASIPNEPTLILELETNQNPAYPTQSDPLVEDVWLKPEMDLISNQTEVPREIQEKKFKILPEILEIRNNKTVPTNMTHIEWLKENVDQFTSLINPKAALPSEILNAPAESDQTEEEEEEDEISTTTTEPDFDLSTSSVEPEIDLVVKAANLTESINADASRSVETLENSEEYSGEQTTSETNAALTSNEDASIAEDTKSSEADDMLFVKEYTIDLSNDEEKTLMGENKSLEHPKEDRKMEDVEMIDVEELEKNKTSSIPTSPSPPEKITSNRTITKRENMAESADSAVFAELDRELGFGSTEKPKSLAQEDAEAREIFQELLEETSTLKPNHPPGSKTKEAESLEKVSQALAKLAFRGSQPLDAGVLGALRDFFSSQYKAYEKNAK